MAVNWRDVRALYAELKSDRWTVTDASFWLCVCFLVLLIVLTVVGR